MKNLVDRMAEGYMPTVAELVGLLEAKGEEAEYLFGVARAMAWGYSQGKVHLRGIIEFSNFCRCRCSYCGLSAEHKGLARYRMMPQEILQVAQEAYGAGYRTLVLQSGEDLWYSRDRVSEVIHGIKAIGDMAVTLSLGERDFSDYRQWREDGADRYLLKHETVNEKLYTRLHPHSSLAKRLQALGALKDLGYQVGSGFIIGLPGQSLEDLARDILFLAKLEVDMAGVGPFIPHGGTSLGKYPPGSDTLTLKALALVRILVKKVYLPATSALLTLKEDGAPKAFEAGANVIMLKLEPHKYRKLYEIYPKKVKDRSIYWERQEMERLIEDVGWQVAKDRGDTLRRDVAK